MHVTSRILPSVPLLLKQALFPFYPSWMLLTYIQFHVPCWMQMQLTYIQNSMSPVECNSVHLEESCPHSNAKALQSCKSLKRIRRIADRSHRSQQYLTQHPSSLNALKATSYSCIISTSQTANVPSSQCHWSTNASKWHVDTSSNIALNILHPQTLDIYLLVLFLLKERSRRTRPCKDSHIAIGICRDFISMNICGTLQSTRDFTFLLTIGKSCSARHVRSSKATIYELHLLIHRCQHHWRHILI